MATPKTRFGFPTRAPTPRRTRVEIQSPTFGLNAGEPPSSLVPGFTPEAENFVSERAGLRPRSGLSHFNVYDLGEPVLGGGEFPDARGNLAVIAASSRSIAFYHQSVGEWSELSYVRGSTVPGDDLPSGTTADYWRVAHIFDGPGGEYIAVLSNGLNRIKWLNLAYYTNTYSDFTWAADIEGTQTARALAAVNDRLVLFNVTSEDGTKYPTRIVYSARGNPKSFKLLDGAGAIDVMDMRGEGTAAVQVQGQLVLFTAEEIWRTIPTLDDYAFRTPERVSDRLGCPYPRTIVVTPAGVLFVAHDLEVYALVGAGLQVVPLGPAGSGRPSRIQAYLRKLVSDPKAMWAFYNSLDRRYELYFPRKDGGTGALYYSLEDQSWFPQRFMHALTHGFEMQDKSEVTTWAELGGLTWADIDVPWQTFEQKSDARFVSVFDANGKIYRMLPEQPDDDSVPIEARWRSHVLNAFTGVPVLEERKKHFSELWIEYESESTASVGVYVTGDTHNGVFSARTVELPPNGHMKHVAVWATGQSPAFEVRIADGSKPKLNGFLANLTDAGRF